MHNNRFFAGRFATICKLPYQLVVVTPIGLESFLSDFTSELKLVEQTSHEIEARSRLLPLTCKAPAGFPNFFGWPVCIVSIGHKKGRAYRSTSIDSRGAAW